MRFAETNGFETNRERPNAWPYRDYVIRSLNADKPYDQFVREQLAGDLLGAPEATAYLVAGPYDLVKSPDINLTLMQRQNELDDMIGTTSTAFLGLTVGCARCHNHKFDPIQQRDYYAMQAIFAGVQHGERRLPETAEATRELQQSADRIRDLHEQLRPYRKAGGVLRAQGVWLAALVFIQCALGIALVVMAPQLALTVAHDLIAALMLAAALAIACGVNRRP